MAIVYADINNDFSPISYNGSILPYGITCPALHFTDEDAISPPKTFATRIAQGGFVRSNQNNPN